MNLPGLQGLFGLGLRYFEARPPPPEHSHLGLPCKTWLGEVNLSFDADLLDVTGWEGGEVRWVSVSTFANGGGSISTLWGREAVDRGGQGEEEEDQGNEHHFEKLSFNSTCSRTM